MKWRRLGEYFVESECKQFRISKAFIEKVARYSLWRKGATGFDFLGIFADGNEAKHAALKEEQAHG